MLAAGDPVVGVGTRRGGAVRAELVQGRRATLVEEVVQEDEVLPVGLGQLGPGGAVEHLVLVEEPF